MKRSGLLFSALVIAARAKAGGVFEFVPAEPGTYFVGQTVAVEVWLHNEESFGIDVRLLGLDIQGLRGRLFAGGEFVSSGGTTAYEYEVGYDSHRRVNSIVNRFQPGGGNPQMVAAYGFSHDANGNPLTQTVAEGLPAFMADDRAFTVDRLNRLTGTQYHENGQVEATTFDLVGNRESHTDRAGRVTAYGTVNSANEYPTIGGTAMTYDAAGNLAVDQAGRQYSYDELNRLKQVKDIGNTVLANYTYDALGRRITFNDPVAGVTTRYYYDGQSVIEERNAADTRVRYHVNGSQYIDERIATFPVTTTAGTATPVYYLPTSNFSITGTGNADGTVIERLDYSSTGDFTGGGPGAGAFYHDADNDLDIDLRDFANFQNCFMQTSALCLAIHDFGTNDVSDGDIDLNDYARFFDCSHGPFVTPEQACGIPQRAGVTPASGVFTLHGHPVDILSDGSTLMDFRARIYLPGLGRWLQRDPVAYNDGFNLYEPFRGNSLSNLDPSGQGILTWLLVGRYDLSDWEFIRQGGVGQAAIGLGTGGAEASLNVVIGAAKGVRKIGYTAADFVVVTVDIPATLAGFPINYDPLSGIGQASRTTDSPLLLTGEVAARGGANIITLGAYNVVEGTIVYAQTGDAEAFSQNVGGQGLLTLGTVGAVRAAPRIQAAARTLPLRTALAARRFQYAADTPIIAEREALTAFATRRGLTPETVRLQVNIGKGLFAESDALRLQTASGEIVVRTQYPQGAVLRGFESVSAVQTAEGLRIFVTDVKATPGNIAPSKLSAFGLNRGRTFTENLDITERAVNAQITNEALREAVLEALRERAFTVRIVGPPGVRISAQTRLRLEAVTGAQVEVVELLPP